LPKPVAVARALLVDPADEQTSICAAVGMSHLLHDAPRLLIKRMVDYALFPPLVTIRRILRLDYSTAPI
jgi:hypothetical protein